MVTRPMAGTTGLIAILLWWPARASNEARFTASPTRRVRLPPKIRCIRSRFWRRSITPSESTRTPWCSITSTNRGSWFRLNRSPACLDDSMNDGPCPRPSRPDAAHASGVGCLLLCRLNRSPFFVLALMAPILASAQPTPKLTSISPEWIQRGTTLQMVFSGENLAAVTGFIFQGEPGLSATNSLPPPAPKTSLTIESDRGGISRVDPAPPRDQKRLVAIVTAAADAPSGAREVRVLTPTGVSNPLLINVGQLPEVAEKEPNNSLEKAQMIELPAAISGVIAGAAQVDYYRFKAAKGQDLVFEVDASRRGSALDSSLAVLDRAGKELARNEDFNGLDSLITFAVPEAGDYVLQLRDFRYQGGDKYTYRLYAGALPLVRTIFPLGGQRGKEVEIALAGVNLAGTDKLVLKLASKAPLGRQDIRAHTPNGFSNPRAFDVSEFPDFLETEPNNSTDAANVVSVPVVINGRIAPAKDIDRFKFKSDKDQKLVCEVLAGRLGSRLDSLLPLSDADGKQIAQNDDSALDEARIEFDAKKNIDYVLSIRDLTDRGGDEFTYRLAIRPPSAAAEGGFTANFSPDSVRVSRGGRARYRE